MRRGRRCPPQARDAWLAWYATTPDAPCIAICSTSQGDAVCKGCGRTFDEVQHWTEMSPAEKRATWRRITLEGTAWRFNRYAERARAGAGADQPPPDALEAVAAPRRCMTRLAPAPTARAASRRWPGRCSSARSRCSPSAPSTRCMVARTSALDLAALAIGGVGLHLGLRRPDGRGARGRADRRPAVRRRQAARGGHEAAAGGLAGARRCRCSAARCCSSRSPSSRWRRPSRRSPTRCAATCAALAVRAAAGAAVHRLSRLQHRRVAAEGGDGAAARRRWR